MKKIMIGMTVLLGSAGYGFAGTAILDAAKIEAATGLKPMVNEQEHVVKVTSPRTDVKIVVDGWTMPPFMGLTSWAAFQSGGKVEVMVMGDLVLLQDEVNPVLSVLLDNGLEVTALHNHFFYDTPKVFFMHLGGEGTLEQLAGGVRKALDKVKEIRAANSVPSTGFSGKPLPATSALTPKLLEDIFQAKGQSKEGMMKFVFGRKTVMPCLCEVGKEMGVNSWAAFAGADENAVVDGDFAVLEDELQPVLKKLRSANLNIVAIHHHMAAETPRILFLHYWGRGKAEDLAKAIQSALAVQK